MWIAVILAAMLAVVCVLFFIKNIRKQRDLDELKNEVCTKGYMIEELERLYIMKNPDRVALRDFLSEKLEETRQMRVDIDDAKEYYKIAGKCKVYIELLEKLKVV